MRKIHLPILFLVLVGCSSVMERSDQEQANAGWPRLMMAPFLNATDNEHAGQALTKLTGSILLEKGIPLYQTEEILSKSEGDTAAGQEVRYLEIAKENKAAYLLIGTVHEYRYKSDLSANPAVGITLRLVGIPGGQTVWQGSSSKVGRGFSSLTSTAQKAVRDLVPKIPLKHQSK